MRESPSTGEGGGMTCGAQWTTAQQQATTRQSGASGCTGTLPLSRHPHSPPPNSPTHQTRIVEAGKMGKRERTGGEWGKWRKMGEMGETGEKWGSSGIAHRTWVVEGCGGMWWDVVEKNGTKMGENGRKMGRNTYFPVAHRGRIVGTFCRRSKIVPTVPFVKNQLTELTDGKMEIFATHRYSLPRRLADACLRDLHLGCGPARY